MSQASVQAIHRIVPKEECNCSSPALDVYAVMSTHVLLFKHLQPLLASLRLVLGMPIGNMFHVALIDIVAHWVMRLLFISSGRACAPVYHRVLEMGAPIDEQIAGKSRIRRRKGNQQVSNKSSLSQVGAGWASRTSQGQITLIQGLLNCFGAACH